MKNFRKSSVASVFALLALLFLVDRAPAAPPAGTPEPGSEAGAKAGCPCGCDCGGCGGGCGCGPMHGGHVMAPMMEGMKAHMEEVRKTVAALREHERKLEGIADPAEFRKAAIEHFRMLDDLQESHVKHMESMMGGGHKHMHHHPGR